MRNACAILQIVTLVLVAVGMALALARALELPGKMRLSRDAYVTVQPIYYPGFTVGALFGEFGAILATAVLLFVTPRATSAFWLTAAALVALLIMHGLYWLLTHPVNKFWLREQDLKGAGATFFGIGGRGDASQSADWKALRNRWEYSHVARAIVALAAFVLLATALTR